VFVVGARPQFIKAAALGLHLTEHPETARFDPILVHSGQHYDHLLSDIFFRELPVPRPDYELDVGGAPPAVQFGQILERLTALLEQLTPAAVVVYGDTTTTLAGALAASYRDVPVVHVEAGERAYRRARYPEETNRVLTDHLATVCLTATERAVSYLEHEGISGQRVRFVGDVMYDLFLWARRQFGARDTRWSLPSGVDWSDFDLATIHRAENTDDDDVLVGLLEALDHGCRPVVLPAHPRLLARCRALGWSPSGTLHLTEPVGYLDMIATVVQAHTVVTDSGGLMREAFFAARPCIVPLANTPWRELAESGWAIEVDGDHSRLQQLLVDFPRPSAPPGQVFGDGRAAARVVDVINNLCTGPALGVGWRPPGSFVG
jgi:UDP-N-acetylglucosamine 2-epimerase